MIFIKLFGKQNKLDMKRQLSMRIATQFTLVTTLNSHFIS